MERLPEAKSMEPEQGTPRKSKWPRITMVTAVRNGAKYIEDTIRSIVNQGYPNLEYYVVDGASTDGTQDIIRKYENYLAGWNSEADKGVYDALNKGFARSTGEIMGWLNASDMLQVNGLFVVGSVFSALSEVEWITGRPTGFSADGLAVRVASQVPRWSRTAFLAGANKYIQQESTFWRRSLWERAGGYVDVSLRAEGDFDLWIRFFRHAAHYSVDALIGGYRSHENALSSGDIDRYNRVCDDIIERELEVVPWGKPLKLFRKMDRAVKPIRGVRALWYWTAEKALYRILARNASPIIQYQRDRWVIRP